ncbi:MAG TPA: alkaline phosphatase family protein [Acidimicrobiales bacterium]
MVLGRSWRTIGTLGVLGAVACLGLSSCHFAVPPKIMVVVMENEGAANVIGNAALPYVNSLAHNYGSATQSYALGHPSLPNYLDIVSGSNEGVTDDGAPSVHSFPTVPTLADQLATAGYSRASYVENLPSDPSNDSGLYAVRHNPWPYFPSAPITVKNSSALIPDLNGSSPPDFVWYTPNLTNDGHTGVPTDTSANELAGAESFLSSFIPSVQATSWYKSGGQIIISWDEALTSDTSGINGGTGGHVATIVVSKYLAASPHQSPGAVNTAGILGSIEHLYQLPFLGAASQSANGNINPLLFW